MREILFRGKSKPWGGWCEGFLVKERDHFRISRKDDLDGFSFVVDPETVGQFTGLTDKNGKKIFEGDYIRIDEYVKEVFDPVVNDGPVIFSRGCFFVGDGSSVLQSLDTICDCEGEFRGEVIGNIYDNPELLEVHNV